MKFEIFDMYGQFYIIPTIAITYDKKLNGYYELTLTWLKWSFSVIF